MPDTISLIARSLSADVEQLAIVSRNVANLSTPGHRAARAVPEFGDSLRVRSVVDMRDGPLQQTGRSLDLAMRGPGFFAIERDGGAALTRNGAFRVDRDGMLVTSADERVLGDSGPIALPQGAIRVDARGELWSGLRSVGRLQLVSVADAAGLRAIGGNAYAYDGDLADWQGTVVQGALEQSNVDPAMQTVQLMETTRHAESVQRAISIYDKAMEGGIEKLGEN